jgi:hypothetical protein
MNIKSTLAAAALALILTAAFSVRAAAAAKTNNVMPLNFELVAWPTTAESADSFAIGGLDEADPAMAAVGSIFTSPANTKMPFTITSRDLINSLAGVTNHGLPMHFSSAAELLFRQVLSAEAVIINSLGTNRQIIVRDISNHRAVDTDISAFFSESNRLATSYSVSLGVQTHKLSTLSFCNPDHLGLRLSAVLVETAHPAKDNDVAIVCSNSGDLQGIGESTNNTPNWIVSGRLTTGLPRLE